MRSSTMSLAGIILFTCSISSQFASAQSLDLATDTISAAAARNAHTRYRSDMSAASRKSTSSVTFHVAELGEIIDRCRATGVDKIKMVIVTLQRQDTAHYVKHHPGLTIAERNDLVGRQTLLVRVPRSAFGLTQSSSKVKREHPLMISLLSAGLEYLEKPYGNLLPADDIYFEIAVICPPPSICD